MATELKGTLDDENLQKEARKRAQEGELENQEELFRCMAKCARQVIRSRRWLPSQV